MDKVSPSDDRETAHASNSGVDFIRAIIADDLRTQKHEGRVATRFPPEPNGYLHIGHAKSICLNFGLALEHKNGHCNLRFDDTNPTTEDVEYVDSIQHDVKWLGFDFGDHAFYASDYFERLYQFAIQLIREGKAYVCDLNEDDIRQYRGTLTTPGRDSPGRARSVEENLDLFQGMRAGKFPDGKYVLRARIDMSAANMKMRDPLLYRIRKARHHRTGDQWPIYPMYDYAHPLSDGIEGITHSICTLEFENNRELYDWVLEATHFHPRPQQIEFARLNLDYTLMSKRKLLQLVEDKLVSGWDDPRMPTIAGMRRRGYTPEAIRAFCALIGVAKNNSTVDIGKLEYCVRDDLNHRAPRVMCVLRPLRVVLTNYPEGKVEEFDAPSFPSDIGLKGSRKIPFSREIFLEREDFEESPPKDYLRLAPGRVIRLRYGYCIRCESIVKDPKSGEITELHCKYEPDTLDGKNPPDQKAWGVVHWVSARHAVPVEVRLYDRLLREARADTSDGANLKDQLNPDSLRVLQGSMIEPSVVNATGGSVFQFERQGYFCVDSVDSKPGALVVNRVVTLRDSWAAANTKPTPNESKERTSVEPSAAKAKSRPNKRSKADARAEARAQDPELEARYKRFSSELGLTEDEADLLTESIGLAKLFEAAVAVQAPSRAVARWLINELPRELGDHEVDTVVFTGAQLGALVGLVEKGTISGPIAKEVFAQMVKEGGDPAEIVQRRGMSVVSDSAAIETIVDKILRDFPDKVAQYRSGKTGLLGFFVGQVMKASGGNAEPAVVNTVLLSRLA